jgi:serine phosphatase RsbU (regulator of sigma subunit)
MFGKGTIREIIRQNARASASQIQEAIISSLRDFQKDVEPEDDVTSVLIKLEFVI